MDPRDPLLVRLRARFAEVLPPGPLSALADALADAAALEFGPDFRALHEAADRRDARLVAVVSAGDALADTLERGDGHAVGERLASWRSVREGGGGPVVLEAGDDVLVVARPGVRTFDSSAEEPRQPVVVLMPNWMAHSVAHLLATYGDIVDALGAPDLEASPKPDLAEALHLAQEMTEGLPDPCAGWEYAGPLAARAAEVLEAVTFGTATPTEGGTP